MSLEIPASTLKPSLKLCLHLETALEFQTEALISPENFGEADFRSGSTQWKRAAAEARSGSLQWKLAVEARSGSSQRKLAVKARSSKAYSPAEVCARNSTVLEAHFFPSTFIKNFKKKKNIIIYWKGAFQPANFPSQLLTAKINIQRRFRL